LATQPGEVESDFCEAGVDAAKYEALSREIEECKREPGTTLDMLHAVQRQFGYLEPQAVGMVAEALGQTKAQLYGVATFYTMFFFEPKPPVIARVCVNLSCHLRGAQDVLHTLEEAAAARPGAFEVEEVMCLGLCEQAPALLINEDAVGQISAAEVLEKVQASVAVNSSRE
jgi:NADH-quinone oxidoreductase subunit E